MSRKKRLLRVGCVTLFLIGFIGYFAFSTFFFSPTEGRFKPDISGLVPRSVDVYLARGDLESAFKSFPDLRIVEELEGNAGFEAFLASPTWREFAAEAKLEETLENVRQQLSQLPLGLDLLDIAGGEDLALAANFAGKGVEDSEWAVYARASFYGKLAVSALKHPGLLGLDRQGIDVASTDGVTTLSGGQLDKPIHVTRIRDVVVAGSSLSLVQRAVELEASGSEDSLLLAAPYGDAILSLDRATRDRDFEVQFDVKKMRDTWGLNEEWPDPKSERFAPAFLGRLLPVAAVRRVLGVIDFDQGLEVNLSGEFSSELMSAAQAKIYRGKSFDQDEVMDVAGFVADDATLFVYLRGPISTILQMVLDSLEPAARENLQSVVRQMGYQTIGEVIQLLDDGLIDRVAFVARPNDWGYEEDMTVDPDTRELVYSGPPKDDENPVFAWAVIGWMSDEAKLAELKEKIAAQGPRIGIHGRTPEDPGYMRKTISGGLTLTEFWSPFVPGTGHIAQIFYGDNLIVSNRYAMINDLVQNRVARSASAPLLSNRSDFQLQLRESAPSANLLVWASPRSGTELIELQAKKGAELRLQNSIDYETKRREVEREVRRSEFGARPRTELTADDASKLDGLVDAELREFRDRVVAENLPREQKSAERLTAYLEEVSSALMMLELSPKDFQLTVRAVTPYRERNP